MSRDFVKERVNNPLTIQFKKGGVFEADGYKSCIVINKFTAKTTTEQSENIRIKLNGTLEPITIGQKRAIGKWFI